MKNIVTRSLSGAVYVGLIVAGIMLGSLAFGIVFALITLSALWEYGRLFQKELSIDLPVEIHCIGGLYLFIAGFLYFSGRMPFEIFLPWTGLFLYLCIRGIFRKDLQSTLQTLAYGFFGELYIALPLCLLCRISFQEMNAVSCYHWELPLALFIFLWLSDTFAYLCGSAFGKHALIPAISPHKSWEGLLGGLLFPTAASFLFAHWFPEILNKWEWMGFALVVVVFGICGDLFESLIKRSLHVKDSGTMIPGHGGLLDRLDSTLLGIPAASLYLFFVL